MNFTKPTILYVDDAEDNLATFKMTFRNHYTILTALSAREAGELLRSVDVQVIITDQRMPEMTGIEFLRSILPDFPKAIRMVLTGYSDVDSIITAINEVGVYRYITKPWNENELKIAIDRAVELYNLHSENYQLMQNLAEYNRRLEHIVRERTSELTNTNLELHEANQEITRLNALLKEENQALYIQTLEEHEKTLRALYLAQQAELRMLRYQINPHFLFNSLNSIGALLKHDPPKSKEMLMKLSDYLRYAVYPAVYDTVTLNEELKMVRNYFDIEKVRFEEKLEITYDIAPATEYVELPAFILQPLAENAVKYGMQTTTLPLRIYLGTQLNNGEFCLTVANTGWLVASVEAKESSASAQMESLLYRKSTENKRNSGVGLRNIQERLKHVFGERYSFEIYERDAMVIATIRIQQADNNGLHRSSTGSG